MTLSSGRINLTKQIAKVWPQARKYNMEVSPNPICTPDGEAFVR